MIAEPAAVPIEVAARELRVSVPTLRRWIAAGAPVARRGRRGRGGAALVCPAAIAAWRQPRGAEHPDLIVLAAEIPALLAAAVYEAHRQTEGPHKRESAGILAAAWYVCTVALLDRLRQDVPNLRDPIIPPNQISQLRAIWRNSGRTA